MKSILAALLAVFIIALAPAAQAEALLGQREVAYLSERDVIDVDRPRPFREIRLCVFRHAVEFADLDVVYGDGEKDDFPVRRVIAKGGCTRWIDLKGRARWLDRIILHYDTFGNSGPRAVVKAYGR